MGEGAGRGDSTTTAPWTTREQYQNPSDIASARVQARREFVTARAAARFNCGRLPM
jgi:hypothetical protein